jgi:hypothetical protein
MSFVDSWDQPGATWDSGLQWDVNVGPSPGDVTPYLNLVTSEHRDKPKFMAMLGGTFQPLADVQVLAAGLAALFDLDVAVGAQLDVVGQWVGQSRNLTVPLTGVYFTFDTAGVGFDEGTWYGPFDPVSGIVSLPDDAYRTLLRATIAANHWDGTIDGAYAAWNILFAGTGFGILIQDLGSMHMLFALIGPTPDAVTLALLKSGYLSLKPAGVKVDAYYSPSVPDQPYFGFGAENANIAGFDTGAWGVTA